MSIANIGLALFVIVLAVDMLGLGLDVVLLLEGFTTITQRVFFHPLLGLVALSWHTLGTFALGLHFYFRDL